MPDEDELYERDTDELLAEARDGNVDSFMELQRRVDGATHCLESQDNESKVFRFVAGKEVLDTLRETRDRVRNQLEEVLRLRPDLRPLGQ